MPTPKTLSITDSVAVLLANGCEEGEALAVVDALYRAGIRADLISLESEPRVVSSHGILIGADLVLDEADLPSYTVLFLPGGMPGTLALKEDPRVRAEVLRRAEASQMIARFWLSWACSMGVRQRRTPASWMRYALAVHWPRPSALLLMAPS